MSPPTNPAFLNPLAGGPCRLRECPPPSSETAPSRAPWNPSRDSTTPEEARSPPFPDPVHCSDAGGLPGRREATLPRHAVTHPPARRLSTLSSMVSTSWPRPRASRRGTLLSRVRQSSSRIAEPRSPGGHSSRPGCAQRAADRPTGRGHEPENLSHASTVNSRVFYRYIL